MKLSKEFKAAVIVIAGIACFFIGFNFLKSKTMFSRTNTYYAYFDHSNGLKSGTPVTVNGVKIGNVDAVTLEEKTAKIKVTLSCSKDFLFSKNSKAEIYSSLLGGTSMQIVPVFDDAPLAESGEILTSSIKEDMMTSLSSKIDPTQEKINRLLTDSNATINSINTLLDEKTVADLKKAISDLSSTMQHLNKSTIMLNKMLATNQEHLNASLQNTNKITADLAKVSNNLANADIDKTIKETQSAIANLNAVLADMEKGNGSLGKLMKDEILYNNLSNSSKQLELLLEDLRLNPKRYMHFSVFGKKQQPYQENKSSEKE